MIEPDISAMGLGEQARRLAERVAELAGAMRTRQQEQRDDCDGLLDTALSLLTEAREALREQAARYTDFTAHAPVIICELAADGTVLFINDAVTDVLGFHPDELQGRNWREVVRSAVEAAQIDALLSQLQEGDVHGYEMTLTTRIGVPKVLLWNATNRHGTDGSIEKTIGFAVDITEQKWLDKALREERDFALAVIDIASTLVMVVNRNGRIVRFNRACEELIGYSCVEVRGRHFWDVLVEPTLVERVRSIFRTLRPEQFPRESERVWWTRAGEPRLIASASVALLDQDGAIEFVVTTGVDITDRRRAEEALRESEERFRGLTESTSDWIWEVDQDDVYTYASPRIKDLLGYSPEEVIGKTPFDLMPEDEAARVAPAFAARKREGLPLIGLENTNQHKDGRLVVLETNGTPFFDAGGRLRGYRGIDRDITERKRAERFRREYASLISHDLRTPLTAIHGHAELLQRKLAKEGQESLSQSAAAVVASAKRMNSMIQDLVDSVRLDAGPPRLAREREHLAQVLSEVVERALPPGGRERTRLEVRAEVPPVLVDRERITRAVLNLISNALKFSPAEQMVLVRLELRAAEAVVSVVDHGSGIAPADQALIFERLYQTEEGQRAGGLGLGLHIAKMIVTAHGGRIWVESEPGQGSTFSLSLPLD